jgi:hypothetical protein
MTNVADIHTAGRTIHSRAGDRQLPDLLQAIFTAELVAPSRCLWVVSPWVSDIPVLDNRANAYVTLNPQWPRGDVRLSSVLATLLDVGTTVHLAVRPDTHNRDLVERLQAREWPLFLHHAEELYEKGLLGDELYLSGSMNFTYNGIRINEEAVHFHASPAVVAENRIVLTRRWGGPRDALHDASQGAVEQPTDAEQVERLGERLLPGKAHGADVQP